MSNPTNGYSHLTTGEDTLSGNDLADIAGAIQDAHDADHLQQDIEDWDNFGCHANDLDIDDDDMEDYAQEMDFS